MITIEKKDNLNITFMDYSTAWRFGLVLPVEKRIWRSCTEKREVEHRHCYTQKRENTDQRNKSKYATDCYDKQRHHDASGKILDTTTTFADSG